MCGALLGCAKPPPLPLLPLLPLLVVEVLLEEPVAAVAAAVTAAAVTAAAVTAAAAPDAAARFFLRCGRESALIPFVIHTAGWYAGN